MAWLFAHMWFVAAAAAVFGVLLGWSVRGIMLVGKLRKAIVERDMSSTELEQAHDEIERLYAAQRGAPAATVAVKSDTALKTELDLREQKLKALTSEITNLKSELGSLKQGGAGKGVTGSTAVSQEADEPPSLKWRNRHLEARIAELEATSQVKNSVPTAEAETAPDGQVAADKAAWQADYLKTRVAALEAELAKQSQSEAAPAASAQETAVPEAENGGPADEELARLRWRNRFLEGRLAYFEGDAENPDAGSETVLPAAGAALAGAAASIVAGQHEADAEIDETSDAIISELEQQIADLDRDEHGSEEEVGEDIAAESDDAFEADELDDQDEDALDEEADEDDSDDADEDEDGDQDEYEDEDDDESDEDEEDDSDLEDDDEEDFDENDENVESDEEESDEDEDDFEDEDERDDESDEDEDYLDEEGEDDTDEDEIDEDDSDEDDADDDEEYEDESEELSDEDEFEEEDDDADIDQDGPGFAEQPLALDRPVEGAPDDLTVIGGVGPKIQEVLNSLGIWHYDQIAAWTPENVAWVDEHLNFSGRISREGWVEQAAILSGDGDD